MNEATTTTLSLDWQTANQTYLDMQMHSLRLRLQRHVHWLRQQWQPGDLHGLAEVVSDEQADFHLAQADNATQQQFYETDPETAVITQALHHNQTQMAQLAEAMQEADTPSALEILARFFGLTQFEQHVLLLCLAPDQDPAFAELFAYVQDHASRKYATPHLALTLFAENEALARISFLPESPLRAFALVNLEPGPLPATAVTARPLQIAPRVADYLRGIDRPDTLIADLLSPIPTLPLSADQQELAHRLAQLIANGKIANGTSAVNLTGQPGVGRQAVAQAVCTHLGLHLYSLNHSQLPADAAEQRRLLRLLHREATLSQLAYYFDLTQFDYANKPPAAVTHLITHLKTVLFVASTEPLPAEQPDQIMTAVSVPKPNSAQQRPLWQAALAHHATIAPDTLGDIVQQFDFGPSAIVRAVTAAQDLARLRAPNNGTAVTAADLWQACRQQSGLRLEQMSQRVTPVYTWDDIVLPDDLFQQLRQVAAQVAHRHQVYETWGFGARLSRGRGISALFAGPSGTGKTMAAEVLANHLNLDLYRIDLSSIVSKYIGETEKNLKQVFDAAEESGAILFFDEADSLFGKRTEVKDSHDRYANLEVNYLLQRMEGYRGLAILATNRKSALDTAFLRRLRFLMDFPFPDFSTRHRIWQKAIPPNAPTADLDDTTLARLEITGGNIRNIALNAAFLAAANGQAINMGHLMAAAHREYSKINKMPTPAEFGDYYAKGKR